MTRTLVVNKENMYKNVMLTHGLINSEKIMMSLVERLGKDKAHELVYEMAMESLESQKDYSDILQTNIMIQESFSEQEILAMLAPENYLGLCAVLAMETAERAKNKAMAMEV